MMAVDEAAGEAVVRFRQELDPEAAGLVLRDAMRSSMMAAASGPLAEDDPSLALFDAIVGEIRAEWFEDGEARIDLATGLAREAVSTVSGRVVTEGGILPYNLTISGTATVRQDVAAAR